MADASTYGLFRTNRRDARTRDYKYFHNLVQRQSTLAGVMLGREEMDTKVKGDPEKWTLFSRTSGVTRRKNPVDPLTIQRDANSVKATVGLRIYTTPLPMVEYEHDILDGSDDNRWASMADQEEADQLTDFINTVDDDLMAVPNVLMEQTEDKSAPFHSLPTLLCPDTNGLPSGFTTMMGVAPGDVPTGKWAPVVRTYGNDPFDYDSGVVEALCSAFDRIKFDKIALRAMQGDPKFRETTVKECGIITGYNGKSLIRRYNARNNDQHGLELAKDGSTIRGIPLICISELDNKNLDYRTTYTDAYPTDEPVFFLPNFKDIHMIAHDKHFMRHVMKDMAARQYDVEVDILENWIGVRARRRDTSAVVCPET